MKTIGGNKGNRGNKRNKRNKGNRGGMGILRIFRSIAFRTVGTRVEMSAETVEPTDTPTYRITIQIYILEIIGVEV